MSLLDAWSATRKALPANGSIMVIELPYCYKKQPDGRSVKAARVKGRHFRVFLNELQPCFFFLSFYVWVTSACMQPSRAATQRFAGLPPVGSATGWTQSHRTGLPPKGEPPGTSTPQQTIEGRSRKASAKLQRGRY
jgi:hypothetical protein